MCDLSESILILDLKEQVPLIIVIMSDDLSFVPPKLSSHFLGLLLLLPSLFEHPPCHLFLVP